MTFRYRTMCARGEIHVFIAFGAASPRKWKLKKRGKRWCETLKMWSAVNIDKYRCPFVRTGVLARPDWFKGTTERSMQPDLCIITRPLASSRVPIMSPGLRSAGTKFFLSLLSFLLQKIMSRRGNNERISGAVRGREGDDYSSLIRNIRIRIPHPALRVLMLIGKEQFLSEIREGFLMTRLVTRRLNFPAALG